MCKYACVFEYTYVCMYIQVHMYVYAYLCIDLISRSSACLDGVIDAHVHSCGYVCVCICVYVYIHVNFFAISVACTLQVF
jgi:hypothetical protein